MIRVAVRELAPVTLVFLRTGLAAALLVPLAARRAELRPLLGRWRPLLAYTAVEVAIPGIEVTVHIEPVEEQASWEDSALLPLEQQRDGK